MVDSVLPMHAGGGNISASEAIRRAREERDRLVKEKGAGRSQGAQDDGVSLQPTWTTSRATRMEDDPDEEVDPGVGFSGPKARNVVSLQRRFMEEAAAATEENAEQSLASLREAGGTGLANTRIYDQESDYLRQRYQRPLSPERASAEGDGEGRSFRDVMAERMLEKERRDVMQQLAKQQQQQPTEGSSSETEAAPAAAASRPRRKRSRWGSSDPAADPNASAPASASASASAWDTVDSAAAASSKVGGFKSRWDETPAAPQAADATPTAAGLAAGIQRSRWDETPTMGKGMGDATPTGDAANVLAETPVGSSLAGMATPTPSAALAAAEKARQAAAGGGGIEGAAAMAGKTKWERELMERNRPMSDEELDAIFPSEGYVILEPPADYKPLMTPTRNLLATPTPHDASGGFYIPETPNKDDYNIPMTPTEQAKAAAEAGDVPGAGDLPFIPQEDMQYFGGLLERVENEEDMTEEERKEREIMAILLKIKNGTPPQRRNGMRRLTKHARRLGAGPLFNQILPLLMSPSLEEQERHLLVKVVDRVLYKLEDLVRPYAHKILSVIAPMLVDQEYFTRVEGREIIANLAKAAGLTTMIRTMRPDIDHEDEFVRNITARAFAVVASALGVSTLVPFLKAVCKSKKSWTARQTGARIVEQIAILMGCAVLPHLSDLVTVVQDGLVDEQPHVRTMAALAIAALAEAAHPYGLDSFGTVLKPLWVGASQHRGRTRGAFLKATGNIVPLMDPQRADRFTRAIMDVLVTEFQSPQADMQRIVLQVVRQCCATDGVEPEFIREKVLPDFFRCFWVRRIALERRSYRKLVDTTVEIANKVGAAEIIHRIVDDLRDDSEPYRRMVMETVDNIIENLGATDVDPRLEEQLIDAVLYAFQEQGAEDAPEAKFGVRTILHGFATVLNALGERTKPYLPQIAATVKWRLNHKSAVIRSQAAELVSRVAAVMQRCGEEQLLAHLGVVLYECLGEEFPDVLASILDGLTAIVNVIGMENMEPPIGELLPRVKPILKNRNEVVMQSCIEFIGRIADRGPKYVTTKEWMRISFDLLELLQAPRKSIRRATVNTFGYIAKAIGPQDVLHVLLNNLRVQDRTNRVCTTIAIAIVAESCQPFTVLPALMNEYRVPEMNIQNGVLKAISFLFQYIGEMGRDYAYAIAPLLEDALMDRDAVHRQTACAAVKHLALGVQGMGCEDVLTHLLNYVWPNIFETSPHIMQAVFEAIEGLRVSLGPHRIMQYTVQGLFHPARRVRDAYWRIYNNLYVYSADALTPVYPRIPDEPKRVYTNTFTEVLF